MTTVATIVNAACRGLGFSPTAAEQADAMEALNMLLMEWAAGPEGLYKLTRENFNLAASTTSYTIGPSQTFNTTMPVRIVKAFTRTDNIDYPIEPFFSMQEYAEVTQKTTTGRPYKLALERGGATTGTVFFYTTPDAVYDFHMWSHKPLGSYTSLSDTLTLPIEYEPALKYNLRVDLASEFGKDLAPQDAARAEQTLSALRRVHSQPVPQIDTNVFCSGGAYFDIDQGF